MSTDLTHFEAADAGHLPGDPSPIDHPAVEHRPSRHLFAEQHADRDLTVAIAVALVCVVAMAVVFIMVARF